MNLAVPWNMAFKFLFRGALKCRRLLPKKRSKVFGATVTNKNPKIGRVYVINLDRQADRFEEMKQELRHVLDSTGSELWDLTERYAAVDAHHFMQDPAKDKDIDPVYSLGDQLFVEPQPLAIPTQLELDSPIRMSHPEIAVARSHINIWRQVSEGDHKYALVLEDDVYFRSGFISHLDQAWADMKIDGDCKSKFDILYLSYEEVKHGAPKTFISSNVFHPVRGLWHLSGYVISREGAKKLLRLLPCRGPVDLWINHQFSNLDVLATRRSIISQRRDVSSTNSYSILPVLTKIGAINSERASLFHLYPNEKPVFVFGSKGSGLSSLAMALSMLGYRCCSDLQQLPSSEEKKLLSGQNDRVFDAYVNIRSLKGEVSVIRKLYPQAKFIITTRKTELIYEDELKILDNLKGADVVVLNLQASNKWKAVCEYLRCAPPVCAFPELPDLGQRKLVCKTNDHEVINRTNIPKRDKSPWVVESHQKWQGIPSIAVGNEASVAENPAHIRECFKFIDTKRWLIREDTFTDNLSLFRPSNITLHSELGAVLSIKREPLGVREYSSASLTSRDRYLYGRFEAVIKATNVPGVVTGFFLHRDSPRQEIDIEIVGNRTDRLLVNVFYNPGSEGSKFDYGYRGAASYIDLGFDASENYHRFAIEWGPGEICWYVDDTLVHRRVNWGPTPIPHLPMSLHVNAWPTRSKELAGRLSDRRLPASSSIKSIEIKANPYRKSLEL